MCERQVKLSDSPLTRTILCALERSITHVIKRYTTVLFSYFNYCLPLVAKACGLVDRGPADQQCVISGFYAWRSHQATTVKQFGSHPNAPPWWTIATDKIYSGKTTAYANDRLRMTHCNHFVQCHTHLLSLPGTSNIKDAQDSWVS